MLLPFLTIITSLLFAASVRQGKLIFKATDAEHYAKLKLEAAKKKAEKFLKSQSLEDSFFDKIFGKRVLVTLWFIQLLLAVVGLQLTITQMFS